LIADSLGGVQSAIEGERKAAPAAAAPAAGEAVRELQQGPARPSGAAADVPNEEFFANLVKTFQDESFQKAMADVLQAQPVPGEESSGSGVASAGAGEASAPEQPKAAAASTAAAASSDGGTEEFQQNFLKSFDQAVGTDGNFEKSLTTLMTSMLSNDLICEPLQQIADHLEPWIAKQKGLAPSERSRYEKQLRMYREILSVYKKSPDPLPDDAREEVQRLLSELHTLGQPPEEVMKQITPQEAEDGESFEDFMKTMGLGNDLGAAEQDLLKKLTEDPEELTKVMKEIGEGKPEEACKQQ
jgi:hypothetical protein